MAATTTETTIASIRDWIGRCGQTYAALGAAAGLDEKSIRQALQPDWNPRAETLRRLERLLPPGWKAGDSLPPIESEEAAA